jgi:hypothetical protein
VNLLFKYCHTVNTLYIKCLRLAKACRTLGDASSKTLRRLEIATGEPVRFDGPGSSINWAKVLKSVQILRNGRRPLRRACTGVAQFEGQTRLAYPPGGHEGVYGVHLKHYEGCSETYVIVHKSAGEPGMVSSFERERTVFVFT